MDDTSLPEILQEILENKTYENLEPFTDSDNWKSLKEHDKALLARLFIKKGEMELVAGNPKFQDSFAISEAIISNDPFNYYQKGLVFLRQGHNARCLAIATESFQKSLLLDPFSFETHIALGETFLCSGVFHNDPSFFQEAQKIFENSYSFLDKQKPEAEAHLLWKWGWSWCLLGMAFEEPFDFHQAIQKYRQAQELGLNKSDFWLDYAEALLNLSELVKQIDLVVEAVDYLHLSVSEDFENYEKWFKLACCHEKLYESLKNLQNFELAHAAFEVAARDAEPNFYLWIRWGKLYLNASKMRRNDDYLLFAIEKFEKASLIESENPILLSLWGEAEMILGMHTEQLESLKSAESKMMRSVKQIPENPHVWGLYGTCLNELGRYFGDEAYYIQAIDKFQQGIAIQSQNPMMWYGLAVSYFSLGDFWGDSKHLENAIRCYQRVLEFGGQHFPQFWNDWGVSLMKLSELNNDKSYLEDALDKFETMLNTYSEENEHPHEPEWLYNYGCALDFMGDYTEDSIYYEKAVTVLLKALQLDPEYTNARYNLAVTLSHLGEATSDLHPLEQAVEHFHFLINLDSEDEMAWNDCGLALLNIAELVHDSIRPERSKAYYDEAEQKFLHAIALGCNHTFYNMSCLHSLLQNYDLAMHYLERADSAGTLPALDDMLHDEWLENLVETPSFRQFISNISSQNNSEEIEQ
jgi:tetratricopeptide (TPR) repeat protein